MNFTYTTYQKALFILIALGALSAYPAYRAFQALNSSNKLILFEEINDKAIVAQTVEQIAQKGSNIASTLKEQLDAEQKALLEEIKKEFSIPSEKWESALATIEALKERDSLITQEPIIPATDEPFFATIYETLAAYSIDPMRVEIELVDTPQSFLAACQGMSKGGVRHIMRVNLAEVAKRTPESQVAFLKHEIIHLLNYDVIELMVIKTLLESCGIKPEEYNNSPAFIAVKKHKEFRADLLAASDSIETAQALNEDFEARIKQFPHEQENPSHCTHPTETQRLQAMNGLISYLEAEKQSQLA